MVAGLDVIVIVLAVLVILLIFAGIKTVPQGYNYTVERFGRYIKTLAPGLNLIVPFIDRVGAKMNMMEQVLDVPTQEVITKDNAIVSVDGVAFYQVLNAPQAAYRGCRASKRNPQPDDDQHPHRHGLDGSGRVAVATATPSTSGCCASSTRRRIAWGVKVNRIEIKDIVPPADLVESMGGR
jgi:regulator of protease activity HflC (stomatin/prohibitin superfamily)